MATGPEIAHLRFALAMHRATAESGGNACLSPYSIASALGLVTRAARGATAAEPAALLTGSTDRTDTVGEQADLLRKAAVLEGKAGQDEPVLAVANTLWAQKELPLKEDFVTELATWPGGTAKLAPFGDDPEAARELINSDVAEITRELIPDLLQRGTVGADTVAALVNAVYLKVAWTFPFQKNHTEPGEFHAGHRLLRVPMMRQSERLGYAHADGWRVVSLPAVGGVEAVVLLPEGRLSEAEVRLTDEALSGLLAARSPRQVNLMLPRLSLTVRNPLKGALRSLGVGTMFTAAADFGALTDDPRLEVSGVEHQSVLRVDESGLEGAAATASMMRLTSAPSGEPVDVEVDRPFLLLVRHAESGALYFLARVAQP